MIGSLIGSCTDKIILIYKLLLTDGQVASLSKAFANNSSANIDLLKTQIAKIMKLGGFIGRFHEPLIKVRLLLMNNAINH